MYDNDCDIVPSGTDDTVWERSAPSAHDVVEHWFHVDLTIHLMVQKKKGGEPEPDTMRDGLSWGGSTAAGNSYLGMIPQVAQVSCGSDPETMNYACMTFAGSFWQ